MVIRILLAGMVILAAGCASSDMLTLTKLDYHETGGFRFYARAPVDYPAADPASEQIRLKWLKEALAMNGCSAYVISSRRATLQTKALLGDVHDIVYEGKCSD